MGNESFKSTVRAPTLHLQKSDGTSPKPHNRPLQTLQAPLRFQRKSYNDSESQMLGLAACGTKFQKSRPARQIGTKLQTSRSAS